MEKRSSFSGDAILIKRVPILPVDDTVEGVTGNLFFLLTSNNLCEGEPSKREDAAKNCVLLYRYAPLRT
ncbi:unnamed protein product [Brassica oleracea var. botrytis]